MQQESKALPEAGPCLENTGPCDFPYIESSSPGDKKQLMDTPPSFPNDTQQTHQKRKQGCKTARELKEGRAGAGEQGAPTE